jgi:hypothetical protein
MLKDEDLITCNYPWVGVIHEAAVLFWGPPRIKNRQDITPTQG